MLKNGAQGLVWYGIHFYPGVAEYREPGAEPYRVFLNEDTLRGMDQSFAGRPIFVEHVDEVSDSVDTLRKEADGWVIESFFNAADGKHWVRFITVTEKAERAIKSGMKLSNAYVPKSFGSGGLWNGVTYAKEITGGEYEHLAIVKHPRYEESVIMRPEEFKRYNDEKVGELKRLSNSQETKGETKMKLNFFKRSKVENTIDPELCVVLPKSGKEVTITELVNAADEKAEGDKNPGMADLSHKVKLHDGMHCSVGELVEKHKALHDEIEMLKAKKEDAVEPEGELEVEEMPVDVESVEEKKKDAAPAEDAGVKEKALEIAEHEDKEIEAAKKKNAKEKAERLKNANVRDAADETVAVEFSGDKVVRGKARYGSNS